MRSALLTATCLGLLCVLMSGGCDFDTSDGDVDRGIASLAAGEHAAGVASFEEAATRLPESPALNFGRGVAHLLGGDPKRATELLLRALESRDSELRQRVYAALGAAHATEALRLEREIADGDDASDEEASLKAWKQAATFLEDALALNPGDVDARHNLELALVRIDPPCASRDDAFEENDSAGTASLIKLTGESPEGEEGAAAELQDLMKFKEQLFSCPDDDDWYRVDAQGGDRFDFALTVPDKGGRLAMRVFDAANNLLGEGHAVQHTVAPDAPAAPLFVQVTNLDLEEVSYSLAVELRPACWRVEDRFEPNDTPAEARQVTPGPVPDLKLCPGNDDWYGIELAEGESVFIYAEPEEGDKDKAKAKDDEDNEDGEEDEADVDGGAAAPPSSPLLLDVFRGFDAEGEPVLPEVDAPPLTRGGQSGKARVATLLTPGPGRYFFRVRGASPDFEGRYALRLEIVPPCPEGDDRFEDNDIPEDATDFDEAVSAQVDPAALEAAAAGGQNLSMPAQQQQGPQVVFARICPGDVDWWRVHDDLSEKMPAIVSLTFDHDQGDLMLGLYDAEGRERLAESDLSTPEQSGEALVLPREEGDGEDSGDEPAPKRPFLLKIEGKEGSENFYLLRVDRPSPEGSPDGEPDDSDDQDDQDDGDEDQDEQQDPKSDDKDDKKDDNKEDDKPRPLEDVLDQLDQNPKNLEADESAKQSPLAGQKPMKDW